MALTDKQRKFIDEYMIDMNATAAYLRAGYKCTEETARANSSRLLTNANVIAEIEQRQDKLTQESGLTVQWVLNNFKIVAERCMQAEAVTDREGNPTGEYRFDSSGANKALEKIGQHLGMFTDKLKVDVSGTVHGTTQDLTQLSPEERRSRIDELNRRRGNGAAGAS